MSFSNQLTKLFEIDVYKKIDKNNIYIVYFNLNKIKFRKMEEFNKFNLTSNAGMRWTNYEEQFLLNQIKENITINDIAVNHKRTTGAINARIKEIAYKMYMNGISIEEIELKTKINCEQLLKIKKDKFVYDRKDLEITPTEKINETKIYKINILIIFFHVM
jgi:hypothetical protein